MSDLFRKEAVTHATRRLAGEVVLASSIPSRVLAGLMIAVILGGVAFASTASYARKETVVGWLTPQAGMIRLTARQGGTVASLHVREGDRVLVGQPIATLTLSSALEGGDSFDALLRSLDAQLKKERVPIFAALPLRIRNSTASGCSPSALTSGLILMRREQETGVCPRYCTFFALKVLAIFIFIFFGSLNVVNQDN